jgi:hypothetical protein
VAREGEVKRPPLTPRAAAPIISPSDVGGSVARTEESLRHSVPLGATPGRA